MTTSVFVVAGLADFLTGKMREIAARFFALSSTFSSFGTELEVGISLPFFDLFAGDLTGDFLYETP